MRWDIWDGFEALQEARALSRSRVLLECGVGWEWFLGDHVCRQTMGSPHPVVPGPLPPRISDMTSFTLAEVEEYVVPVDAGGLLRHGEDYAAYQQQRLAPPPTRVVVPAEGPVAEPAAEPAVDPQGAGGRHRSRRTRVPEPATSPRPAVPERAVPSGARRGPLFQTDELGLPPFRVVVTGPDGRPVTLRLPFERVAVPQLPDPVHSCFWSFYYCWLDCLF